MTAYIQHFQMSLPEFLGLQATGRQGPRPDTADYYQLLMGPAQGEIEPAERQRLLAWAQKDEEASITLDGVHESLSDLGLSSQLQEQTNLTASNFHNILVAFHLGQLSESAEQQVRFFLRQRRDVLDYVLTPVFEADVERARSESTSHRSITPKPGSRRSHWLGALAACLAIVAVFNDVPSLMNYPDRLYSDEVGQIKGSSRTELRQKLKAAYAHGFYLTLSEATNLASENHEWDAFINTLPPGRPACYSDIPHCDEKVSGAIDQGRRDSLEILRLPDQSIERLRKRLEQVEIPIVD